MVARPDEILPLFRAIRLVGLMGLLILLAGTIEFVSFEPPGQATGTTARIEGVYPYDPGSHSTNGGASSRFAKTQPFAAVVDWSSIPASTTVTARWFDSFGEVVGQTKQAQAGQQQPDPIPVALPKGLKENIPGTYLFVVERISKGQPVEVLARTLVEVQR